MWKCERCGKTHIKRRPSLSCSCLVGMKVRMRRLRFWGFFGIGPKYEEYTDEVLITHDDGTVSLRGDIANSNEWTVWWRDVRDLDFVDE